MAEPEARELLYRLLKRREKVEVANRLVAFLLAAACLYLLLLGAVLLLGLSLFGFHLGLYLGLSLFPFFLLLPAAAGRLAGEIRRLDEHCLLEAYLSTSSAEHQAFMTGAVCRLLERREAERAGRFSLGPHNRRLALACGCLFLLFEVASYLTLFRLEPSLSPRALRNRLADRAAVAAFAELSAQGWTPRPEPAEAAEAAEQMPEGSPGGEAGSEAARQQEPGVPQGVREAGAEEAAALPAAGSRRERILLPVEPEAEGGASLTEVGVPGSPGRGGDPGRSPAGAGETGRSFVESPLREYRGVPERIEVPGGREMAASSSLAELQPDPQLASRFADYAAPIALGVDFDPLLEQIRGRYLELLDARF